MCKKYWRRSNQSLHPVDSLDNISFQWGDGWNIICGSNIGGNLNIWENFLGQIEQNAGHWAASITCMHHIPQLVKEGLGNLFARLDIDELEQENENGLCDQSLLVSLVISHRNCSTIQLLWADILSCGNCGPFLLPPNHHGEEVDHLDHGDDNEKLCRVG